MKKITLFCFALLAFSQVHGQSLPDLIAMEKRYERQIVYLPDNGNVYKTSSYSVKQTIDGRTQLTLNNAFLMGSAPFSEATVGGTGCDAINFLMSFLLGRGVDPGTLSFNCYSGTINNVSQAGAGQINLECLPSSGVCFVAF